MHLLAQMPTWANLQTANPTPGPGEVADVATIGSLPSLFSNVVSSVTALAGVVLFVMLVIGGFNFLLSGGDQKKLEKAKGTITSAFTGFVLLIASYLILRLIQNATGVTTDLTKFQLQIGQ